MQSRDYEEKRDFIRMRLDCPAQCRGLDSGEEFVGQARDLSGTGLRLELSRSVPLGALLEVHVEPAKAVVEPLHPIVEVMRAEPDMNGARFLVGTTVR